ncbi:hypothetical protein HMPREF0444_0938 [Granulicatella adiacens ATCC 49175]|uniref:Uncharacterized protein n=1 Tax=Granulicatella adiacens ATCC 49175 TaxID=638301 RepID=C8NG93_9LACT|nr:hypothetical protein HMPREF0444_0938 [Granulicatella adiacens ATCC 49175]
MIEKHLQFKLSRGIKLVFPLECSFKKGERPSAFKLPWPYSQKKPVNLDFFFL